MIDKIDWMFYDWWWLTWLMIDKIDWMFYDWWWLTWLIECFMIDDW
jgi:hypothetical protein